MSHFLSHTAASVSWIILNPISTNFSSKLISLRRMRWTPPCHDSVWFNNDRVGWNFCSDASYIPTKSSSSSVWYKLYTFKLTYLLYKKISEKPSGFPRGPSQLVLWQHDRPRDGVTVFCDILWRVWCYQVISARIDMSPSIVSLNMRHRRE